MSQTKMPRFHLFLLSVLAAAALLVGLVGQAHAQCFENPYCGAWEPPPDLVVQSPAGGEVLTVFEESPGGVSVHHHFGEKQ